MASPAKGKAPAKGAKSTKTGKTEPTCIRTGETLANRHRPRTWDDVCGHTKVVSRLKGMIKSQELPNAILFAGPSGTGKTTLSRVLARYINCETMDACGECVSCLAMDNMRHPDYQEINCADARGIDEMRNLLQQAKFMPQLGNLRIIVMDEFQQATPQAMQTALKSLEEPPSHTLFIVCTMEPEKVHQAVIGRCQLMELQRVYPEYVTEHLARIAKDEGIEGVSEQALELIASSTGGQLRNAIQTLDAVSQVIRGQDEELEGEELEELVMSAIVDASGVTDELVATKVLVYLHAVKINGKSTIRGVMKALIDVQSSVPFVNALLWQNSYLIDLLVDPKSKAIYHTAANRNLVKLLNEKVDRVENYGSSPNLSTCLAIQQHLFDLRQKLVQVSGQDRPMMQVMLANAYQDAAATVK